MKKNIKQVIPCSGDWKVAVVDSDSEGSWLLPVACWALVNGPEIVDGEVEAIVVDPEYPESGLCLASDFGDRFLGLSDPTSGPDNKGHWDQLVIAQAKAEREDSIKEEVEDAAKKIVGDIPPSHLDALRRVKDGERRLGAVGAHEAVTLLSRGLIVVEQLTGLAREGEVYTSSLGVEVLRLAGKQGVVNPG